MISFVIFVHIWTIQGGETIDLADDAHYDYTDSLVVKQEVLDVGEATKVAS